MIGGLGALLLGGAAVVWLAASPEPGGAEREASPPAIGLSRAGIVLRHRGRKQAEIAAERVEVSADGQTAIFTGLPRAIVFVDDARLTATGGRIVFNRTTQDVRVEGGLRITTAQGETLTARSASWDQARQLVDLTGGVEVTFPLRRRGR